jgi:hypothetical protein
MGVGFFLVGSMYLKELNIRYLNSVEVRDNKLFRLHLKRNKKKRLFFFSKQIIRSKEIYTRYLSN